jgi:hypothetical protein
MLKFNSFFTTKVGKEKIVLIGEEQQKHEIILTNEVEYFALDEKIKPCLTHIDGLKACDYVIADHSNKRILLCELKNRKRGGFTKEAEEQLRHSKHLINCFLKILKQERYKYSLLILSKKRMNKRSTKNDNFKPRITSKNSINLLELIYS